MSTAAVGVVTERNDRPAYVRFKRVAVEDKAASLAAGKFVAKDVDYALITPPYSKDCVEVKVSQWKANLEADVRNDRIPQEWADRYFAVHQAWLNGQELPPDGTAIRGWGVLSPAQQENLIRLNILTVEDLANANDEGMRRIGMGALDLKNKAQAWLAQLHDKGPLTQEVAQLRSENALLKDSLENMQKQMKLLESKIVQTASAVTESHQQNIEITADDILPEDEPTIIRKKR